MCSIECEALVMYQWGNGLIFEFEKCFNFPFMLTNVFLKKQA